MLLFELPPELLLVIYESLPDIRTLYNFTLTCSYAQALYCQESHSIIDHIIRNSYSDSSETVQNTINAFRSLGELDYAYIEDHNIEWILPESLTRWTPTTLPPAEAQLLLQNLSDLVHDTENLADWFTPLCQLKASWNCDPDASIRQSVVNTLFRLQLATNRLYNVRLPSFPEHVSLRTYERNKSQKRLLLSSQRKPSSHQHQGFLCMDDQGRTSTIATTTSSGNPPQYMLAGMSRKIRDQAQDLMKDHLRSVDLPHLRNMWFLMQMLQDEYLLLRRHRLRPRPGSLMDLLFEHNSDEFVWSPSPWFTVQSLLSDLGVHVVPARPGTSFRFLGYESTHELQQKDVAEFVHYHSMAPAHSELLGCDRAGCLGGYLERFRGLIGLPFRDLTPVEELVEWTAPIRATGFGGGSGYWANARSCSTVEEGQSVLGALLLECGQRNQKSKIARAKNRLRVGGRREEGVR